MIARCSSAHRAKSAANAASLDHSVSLIEEPPAAGLGTRLRPLTEVVPKPLCLFYGRPILDLVYEQIKRGDFGASHEIGKGLVERQDVGIVTFEADVHASEQGVRQLVRDHVL